MSKIYWILGVLVSTLFISGCGTLNFKVGLLVPEEYAHDDMSGSPVALVLEERADELVEHPRRPRDFKVAAEIYGSIGKLDKMKMAALKYLEHEPEDGARLLRRWQKTRKWYKQHKPALVKGNQTGE